jgi:hypothetical protein
MSLLAVIHCFVWYFGVICFGTSLAESLDPLSNLVDKFFREDVLGVVEMGRVPGGYAVAVVKIPI